MTTQPAVRQFSDEDRPLAFDGDQRITQTLDPVGVRWCALQAALALRSPLDAARD